MGRLQARATDSQTRCAYRASTVLGISAFCHSVLLCVSAPYCIGRRSAVPEIAKRRSDRACENERRRLWSDGARECAKRRESGKNHIKWVHSGSGASLSRKRSNLMRGFGPTSVWSFPFWKRNSYCDCDLCACNQGSQTKTISWKRFRHSPIEKLTFAFGKTKQVIF